MNKLTGMFWRRVELSERKEGYRWEVDYRNATDFFFLDDDTIFESRNLFNKMTPQHDHVVVVKIEILE